ncbi:MAG: hypothetical protein NTV30_02645, partial [Chloroflexi bacterium]|nr:hypothetical protein [Chloroflexota bacterium]
MKRFFKNQLSVLLLGFVFWFPLAVTIYILYFLLGHAERLGKGILEIIFTDTPIHAGFGIILFIIIVYFSGVILRSHKIREMLSKIPILGLFFGQGEIITINRLMHMQPCLFLISPTCISYGWILSEENVQLGKEKAGFSLINVYHPNVPTLVTGQVFA